MVKGLSRRVIVVDSPDPHIFEQAIFIVRNDAAVGSGGVTSQQVVDQAIRIAKDYARTHGAPPRRRLRMSPWLAALLGGAAIGAGLGALTGFFVKRGVDEDFQDRVRNLLTQKDEAAVFMVVSSMTEDKFAEAMRPFGGDILQTSLSIKDEEELKRELGKC